MEVKLTRRSTARGIAFFAAICLVLGGLAWSGYATANRYRTSLENTYQRALDELSDHVANIEVTLNKAYYANTAPQLVQTATKLFSESGQAKDNLSALPVSTNQLEEVNKFISQVGDYAQSLSKKAVKGEEISTQDREKIKVLLDYAKTVSEEFGRIDADYSAGGYAIGKREHAIANNTLKTTDAISFSDSFIQMGEGFTDYPTLIYDGPFSDHLLNQTPALTRGKKQKSQSDAKKAAAAFLGVSSGQIEDAGETGGNLPCWNYAYGDIVVSVTKQGGLPGSMLNPRAVTEEKIDRYAASRKAKEYLEKLGFTSLKESYTLTRYGICTINFAPVRDGVICYPDLIQAGVALDNGEILSFTASGYIMNHHTRDLSRYSLSEEEAREKVSEGLIIRKAQKALIPTEDGKEALCYEFTCTGKDNEDVLVYINGQTGLEEQILILLETEGGTLAM